MPLRPATLAVLLALPAPAVADRLEVAGPWVTAFDWATERCETWDIPDAPARAWRGPDGLVRLVAGSARSRAEVGADLDRLRRRCDVLHEGARADDPALYDDRSWIAATHADAAGRVVALAHVEHHGHLRPGACAAGSHAACWRNAVVELASDDGGLTFRREAGPGDVVAALPYPHDPAQARRAGYFNPSNVVERDGFLYAFVFAEAYGAQERGACLLRRPAEGGAADWRAWDGAGFGVRFADPYREAVADPAAHVCAPLPGLSSTVSSVAWHAGSGRFLAVTPATRRGPDGVARPGIWWMASEDLLAWSEPELLVGLPLLWDRDCGAPAAYAYPSLLDPDSPSRNFEAVDDRFRLYLVRMAVGEECRIGPDRDLVFRDLAFGDLAFGDPAGRPLSRPPPGPDGTAP